MKTIVIVGSASEAYSVIYRYEKTRRIISTSLAPNVKQKYVYVLINYVFIFLTLFPKYNLLYLTLTNTLELLVQFDRLLPIVSNFVLSPKQKVYVDTSVIIIFVDAIRG